MSYDVPRKMWENLPERRQRRFSLTHRRTTAGQFGDEEADEGDGDLGFGAASEQEGSRRKVIVERLEMVKSKPPVFTWC